MKYEVVHVVLGRANPHRMNGVNKVVYNLATHQTNQGQKVCVLGITESFEKEPEYSSIYETCFVPPGSISWRVSSELESFLNENPKATYHLHGAFIPVFFKIHRSLKRNGSSYVFTPHGSYTKGAMTRSSFKKKVFFSLFEKSLLKHSKVIQVLGHMEESDTKELFPQGKFALIPNGQRPVDLHHVRRSEELVFGYCGRVTRYQKGLDLLLEGFVSYKKQGGKGKLWVIGDGEYLHEMKNWIQQERLSDEVVFYGAVYGEEKDLLMYQLSAFLHPSRNEGLPTAALESCALGVPLVVTQETSMDRYVRSYKAGWVIQELSGAAVCDSLFDVEGSYIKRDLKALRENVYALYEGEFNWEKIAADLISVYDS